MSFTMRRLPVTRGSLSACVRSSLLGLTATPERSDGLPILHWFDDRIAAELRLWDAIEQQHLVPFQYFGIHDGIDLRDVPWRRGAGYDVGALSDVYTGNDAWARQVIQQVQRFTDPGQMRCLGFCVNIEHARFMARKFEEHGIPAVAVWADTPGTAREQALRDLASGSVRAVFSVDLFNEGVDVPTVDTVLMLRPTESPVLFLQQLGRGLRKAPGKSVCSVLDFVGTHRKEFRFDRRYRALLNVTRREPGVGRRPTIPLSAGRLQYAGSIALPQTSSFGAFARRSRPDGRRRWKSSAPCVTGCPISAWPGSLTSRVLISTTSMVAIAGGPISFKRVEARRSSLDRVKSPCAGRWVERFTCQTLCA